DLLIGRAESVAREIETRSKVAGEALGARVEHLTTSIKINADEAHRSLTSLASTTTQVIGTIKTDAGQAERSLTQLPSSPTHPIRASAQDAERMLLGVSTEV